jgi:hypothetical protein
VSTYTFGGYNTLRARAGTIVMIGVVWARLGLLLKLSERCILDVSGEWETLKY